MTSSVTKSRVWHKTALIADAYESYAEFASGSVPVTCSYFTQRADIIQQFLRKKS